MLKKRLLKIVEFVEQDMKVCDIGCDHGYLSIYLLKNNLVKKIIASDIVSHCVNLARKNADIYDVNLEVIESNGLDNIDVNDIDTLILSGMGGSLIVDILSKDINKLNKINNLILSPQSNPEKVRKFIIDNNFTIIKEALIDENNKNYVIIKATRYPKENLKSNFDKSDILNLNEYLLYGKYNFYYEKNNLQKNIEKQLDKYNMIIQNNDLAVGIKQEILENINNLNKIIDLIKNIE